MHIVFHSNFLNHHQRAFVEYLVAQGCKVHFIAYEDLPEERKAMGYSTEASKGIQIQYSEQTKQQVYQLTMEADAVIFGSKPKELFRARVQSGKLTFNYSERLFKRGEWQKYSPIHQFRLRRVYLFDREHAPYVLAAGNYAVQDYKSIGYPKNHFLKWGYFPPLTSASLAELLQQKQENSIVWVARFIDWKHPECVVELGRYLKEQNVPFHIKMIGTGELLEQTKAMIEACGLTDVMEVVGAMPPEQVRKEFEQAQIALLTSDRNEGWGAVVNEAMNSACAMVASDAIGSTTYLIQNHVNGMTYGTDKKQMFRIVQQLLLDRELCNRLGGKAYETIVKEWNYQVAADRFVEFVRNRSVSHISGPMSKG